MGDLAESWDVSDDGLIITFHLRQGRKMARRCRVHLAGCSLHLPGHHRPQDTDGLCRRFQTGEESRSPRSLYLSGHLRKTFRPGPRHPGACAILPAHLLEGKDITKSPLSRNPVGTGPYRLKEWIAGQKVVLESYHDYFEGRPYIDRYVYRIIPDSSTMYMELKSGGLDMMALTPVQYQRQTDTPEFQGAFPEIPLSGIVLRLSRLQSQASAVQGQEGATGPHVGHQQGRDHPGRPSRHGTDCPWAVQTGNLGPFPAGQGFRL